MFVAICEATNYNEIVNTVCCNHAILRNLCLHKLDTVKSRFYRVVGRHSSAKGL